MLNVKSALFLLAWTSHLRAIYVPSTLPLRRVKGFLTHSSRASRFFSVRHSGCCAAAKLRFATLFLLLARQYLSRGLVLHSLVRRFGHGRSGHIGALLGQSGVGQVAAGVLAVGHVHVGDDVHDAAVGLLGQALVNHRRQPYNLRPGSYDDEEL